jgi:histone acetyltransferase
MYYLSCGADLGTMSKRLDEGYYDSKEVFISDVELIVSNCKLFNAPETAYYKAAVGLQKRFRKLVPKLD